MAASALRIVSLIVFSFSNIGDVTAPGSKWGCIGSMCGRIKNTGKITGNSRDALPADLVPGLVSLGHSDNGHQHDCTGVMVERKGRSSHKAVLTTGLCVHILGAHGDNIWAMFEDGNVMQIKQDDVHTNRKYEPPTDGIGNEKYNYGVVMLSSSVKRPTMSLPEGSTYGDGSTQINYGTNVFVAAWKKEGNTYNAIKRNAKITHISECDPTHTSTSNVGQGDLIYNEAICVKVDRSDQAEDDLQFGALCYAMIGDSTVLLGLYSRSGRVEMGANYYVNVRFYESQIKAFVNDKYIYSYRQYI